MIRRQVLVGAIWILVLSAGARARSVPAVSTNSGGSAVSDEVLLTVSSQGAPPAITKQPSHQTVRPGGTATFVVAASGNPTPTMQWQVSTDNGANWGALSNGAPYGGVTTTALNVDSTTVDPYLVYRAVASNNLGSVASEAATLEVNRLDKYLVVMRVVVADWVTDQYSSVSWEQAAPIKATADFQWFEATIWTERNAVHLYKFDASFNPAAASTMTTAQWIAYRESHRVQMFDLPTDVSADQRSRVLRDGFQSFFKTIVTSTPALHYGLRYSGHGSGNGGLFQRLISPADARGFLANVTALIGRPLDFLDLGGNCDEGDAVVMSSFFPYADYIIASDIPIGGYTFDNWTIERFHEVDPDYQLPLILTPTRSIRDGLVTYLDLARRRWEYSKQNMIFTRTKQALSLYRMDQFSRLAQLVSPELKRSGISLSAYNHDLFAFIKSLNRSDIESQFLAFRTDYRSNKDFFSWDVDNNGLDIYDPNVMAGCTFSLPATGQTLGQSGGTGAVAVVASSPECMWTAMSNAPDWLIVSAGSAGTGSGIVRYAVSPNTRAGRMGTISIAGSTFTVTQTTNIVSAMPGALTFGATASGTTIMSVTGPQTVTLAFDRGQRIAWTAVSNQLWLQIVGGSGSAAGTFTVGVAQANVPAGSTSLSATITITATGASNSPLSVPVTLTVTPVALAKAPLGNFDTPVSGATGLSGSVAVTGWALDDVGVTKVEIWRDPVTSETTPPYTGGGPGNGKIFISNALFIQGARPDIETAYPAYPANTVGGWGYLMLTHGLWNQGNGTYKLYAFAYDGDNNVTTLGTKTITVDNLISTKPFGAIDTPGQGATVNGAAFVSFGWGLTPNATPPCTIPPTGVQVSIDSGPLQAVTYGDARSDIAGAFPGLTNTATAGGHFYIDTTTMTNGTHQIGWLVTDSCGRTDGVGSRFFSVLNAGGAAPVPTAHVMAAASAGDTNWEAAAVRVNGGDSDWIWPDENGTRAVRVAQGQRIEVRLPRWDGVTFSGYQDVHGDVRPLPTGSTLDGAAGVFSWEPAPGFLGPFDLVFVRSNGGDVVRVRMVVEARR